MTKPRIGIIGGGLTGLALQAPFCGVKHSSTNSFKEQGASAVDFYTQVKSVYLDYSA